MSKLTPVNDQIRKNSSSALHMVTKDMPESIAKLGHYPTSDSNDKNEMSTNQDIQLSEGSNCDTYSCESSQLNIL